MQKRVLIVDDDPVERQRLESLVARIGYHPVAAAGGLEALSVLDDPDMLRIDAVILDLVMPDLDGMAVLAKMKETRQTPPVIMHITEGNIDQVSSTIRAGALDFIVRPAGIERLTLALSNSLRRQALEAAIRDQSDEDNAPRLSDLIGTSDIMQRLRAQAHRAARSSIPVLVTGPDGAGKSRLIRAIHRESDRWGKALLTLHGGSTNPADLRQNIENCLNLKGAMLISHVGLLDADCQSVLSDAFMRDCFAFTPGGPKAARKVRLYATSLTDLADLSREGNFRADLAMRLSVQPLRMPGLNERPEDLLPLIEDILARVAAAQKDPLLGLTPDAVHSLRHHIWTENIRGLQKTIRQAASRAEGGLIRSEDFALETIQVESGRPFSQMAINANILPRYNRAAELTVTLIGSDRRLRPFDEIEADILKQALNHCDHHIGRAASALGIGRSTFYRKARDFGLLDSPDFASGFTADANRISQSGVDETAPAAKGRSSATPHRGEAA